MRPASYKVTFLLILMSLVSGCSGNPPSERGVEGGVLSPCPPRPNCVSTMSLEERHTVSPLRYNVSHDRVAGRIEDILKQMDGVFIKEVRSTYIWAECSSKMFGFVDDLELYFPKEEPVIHVRSAARTGYYDMGVNRKRVEKLRELLAAGN